MLVTRPDAVATAVNVVGLISTDFNVPVANPRKHGSKATLADADSKCKTMAGDTVGSNTH